MKKTIAIMLTSIFCFLILNGCSTIEGAGNDLQGAGQVISNEAKKARG